MILWIMSCVKSKNKTQNKWTRSHKKYYINYQQILNIHRLQPVSFLSGEFSEILITCSSKKRFWWYVSRKLKIPISTIRSDLSCRKKMIQGNYLNATNNSIWQYISNCLADNGVIIHLINCMMTQQLYFRVLLLLLITLLLVSLETVFALR